MRDTIDMAREAGINYDLDGVWCDIDQLVTLVALVRADEREKFCAVLRQLHDSYSLQSDPSGLKARGNT